MKEHELMDKARIRLTELGFASFRANVGTVRMTDGRYFNTGLPKGFSDIFAVDKQGKAYFFETKIKPNKPTLEQLNFLEKMRERGCFADVIYNLDELETKLKEYIL
jgi:hypothetical protein